jgi:hypothetical protein
MGMAGFTGSRIEGAGGACKRHEAARDRQGVWLEENLRASVRVAYSRQMDIYDLSELRRGCEVGTERDARLAGFREPASGVRLDRVQTPRRQVRGLAKIPLKTREIWSGRGDLNARPPAPKASERA